MGAKMELITFALAFTILLFCAFVASLIAMRKGRSGLRWLFLGFLLGPFALAVALLVPSLSKKCPKCANYVRIEAHICRCCGYGFRPSSNKNRDSFRIVEATNNETIIGRIDDSETDKTIIKRIDDFESNETIIKRIDDSESNG